MALSAEEARDALWAQLRRNTERCLKRAEDERQSPNRKPESFATENRLRREAVLGACLLDLHERTNR